MPEFSIRKVFLSSTTASEVRVLRPSEAWSRGLQEWKVHWDRANTVSHILTPVKDFFRRFSHTRPQGFGSQEGSQRLARRRVQLQSAPGRRLRVVSARPRSYGRDEGSRSVPSHDKRAPKAATAWLRRDWSLDLAHCPRPYDESI